MSSNSTATACRESTYLSLPEYLRNTQRFVLWKRVKEKNETKFRKVPYDARSGKVAFVKGTSRFDYYSTLDVAISAYEASHDEYAGLGLDLNPGYEIGVDFDGCVEKRDDGHFVIDPEVQAKLIELNSYSEYSPSCFFEDEARGGIKVFLLGKAPEELDPEKPADLCIKRFRNVNNAANHQGVEIHARQRFFTLTARPVPGCPFDVRKLSREEIDALYRWAQTWHCEDEPSRTQPATDVFGPLLGKKVADLLAGKWETYYPSSSEALHAIITTLVIQAGGDTGKADQEFRKTDFYKNVLRGNGKPWREDWERLRESQLSLARTNAHRYFERLQHQIGRKKQEPALQMVLERADKIDCRPLEFLWKPYLPKAGLVHFGGISREGKSPVLIDLCARITKGKKWPDGEENAQAGSCLLLSAEDDWPTVVVPRFKLAGGDTERLFRVRMSRVEDTKNQGEAMIALDRDFTELMRLVQTIPDLALIGIDPISNYLGSKEMNKDAEVRSILMELVSLAEQRGFVVVTIGHLNRRDKGTHPLHRVLGAGAFHSVPRFVYMFGPDRDSSSLFAHVMAQARGTLYAPSLRYRTELEGDNVKVVWDGKSTVKC